MMVFTNSNLEIIIMVIVIYHILPYLHLRYNKRPHKFLDEIFEVLVIVSSVGRWLAL